MYLGNLNDLILFGAGFYNFPMFSVAQVYSFFVVAKGLNKFSVIICVIQQLLVDFMVSYLVKIKLELKRSLEGIIMKAEWEIMTHNALHFNNITHY